MYDPDWVYDQLPHDELVGKYVMMNRVDVLKCVDFLDVSPNWTRFVGKNCIALIDKSMKQNTIFHEMNHECAKNVLIFFTTVQFVLKFFGKICIQSLVYYICYTYDSLQTKVWLAST